MKCDTCLAGEKFRVLWEHNIESLHNPGKSGDALHKMDHLISAWVGTGQGHRTRWKGRGLCRVSSVYRKGLRGKRKRKDFGSVGVEGRKNECGEVGWAREGLLKSCLTLDFILRMIEGF